MPWTGPPAIMSDTLGIGILGFAHGHVLAYANQWRDHPGWGVRLVAGWDHDGERLAPHAANYGLAACDDPAELLARDDVQAVVIASETSLHAELVEQAAAAGKAIALQKPISTNLADADHIVAAVERHGVPFSMAWQMRVDPQNLAMRDMVRGGRFGRVLMVRRRHGLSLHQWPGFADLWHADPKLNRNMWADDAAHPFDFALWMFGEPGSITAEIESLVDPRVPFDNGVAALRYDGGPLVVIECSFTCPAGVNTTEIACENGTIIQDFGDAVSCNIPRDESVPGLKWYDATTSTWTTSDIATPKNHGERLGNLAEPLAAFFHGRRGPVASAEEGRAGLRLVLASLYSAEHGRRVSPGEPALQDY